MRNRIATVALHRVYVSRRTNWLIVEVTTSDGVTGTGECSDLRPIDAAQPILDRVNADLRRHVIGSDLMSLDNQLGTTLGPTADPLTAFQRRLVIGAVITALCDINAQVANQPLSSWLGAVPKATVQLYANINRAPVNRLSDEFADVASEAVASGFQTLKLAPFDGPATAAESRASADIGSMAISMLRTGIEHLEAVRAAIGPEPTLLVDVHHRLSDSELEPAVRAMESLDIGWIEDAVDVRRPDQLEKLAAMTDIPIAGGEQLTEEAEIAELCAGGWLDYLLLDPKYIGGPLRFRSILDAVDNVILTLHDPTGPISTAVSSHLTLLAKNPGPLEYAFGEMVDRGALTVPGERLDGCQLIVGDAPGIGQSFVASGAANVETHSWEL